MDELVERCFLALMNDRKLGMPLSAHFERHILKQRIAAIIPIVQDWQRERDAAIAEGWMQNSMLSGDCDTEIQQRAGQNIAAAIRNQEPTDG